MKQTTIFSGSKKIFSTLFFVSTALSLVSVSSCGLTGKSPTQVSRVTLKNLSQSEALADFNQIAENFRSHYGPLKLKEQSFGFNFDELVESYRSKIAAATTDSEFLFIYASFLGEFHDGHVSFSAPVLTGQSATRALIPINLVPVEGKAIVETIGDAALAEATGIEVGDEILSVDGINPVNAAPEFAKVKSFGNDESDKHAVVYAFRRANYMGKWFPSESEAKVIFKKTSGEEIDVNIPWRKFTDLGERARGSSASSKVQSGFAGKNTQLVAGAFEEFQEAGTSFWGAVKPFYVTPQVLTQFKIASLQPDVDFLKKYGQEKAAPIFSSLHRFDGKTILTIRQAGYSPAEGFTIENYIGTYKAILDQYESLADVLVVDQTHNPGGSVSYVSEMARLFATAPLGNFVQAQRADRKWIEDFRSEARGVPRPTDIAVDFLLNMSNIIEKAYDAGDFLTKPLSFDGRIVLTAGDFVWKKPVLVLINELAGSGGDAFPMILKNGKVAKLFGKRTMGLGGSVEDEILVNTRAKFRVTRGLFTSYKQDENYTRNDFIENIGVQPDVPFDITLSDLRAGYVGYVEAFSKEAVALVK